MILEIGDTEKKIMGSGYWESSLQTKSVFISMLVPFKAYMSYKSIVDSIKKMYRGFHCSKEWHLRKHCLFVFAIASKLDA